MPNWCSQHVEVYAKTKEELTEFISFCKQTHTAHHKDFITKEWSTTQDTGVFWNFVSPTDTDTYFGITEPAPKEKAEFGSAEFWAQMNSDLESENDWWNWNVRNWGTKWDIDPDDLDEDEIQAGHDIYWINWNFQTAWSPAEPIYALMSQRFPNLRFEYQITEEANFYAGTAVFEDGEAKELNWVNDPEHSDFISLGMYCDRCGTDEYECSLCDECFYAPCECEQETNLVVSADTSGA